jgi:hypothetical protein
MRQSPVWILLGLWVLYTRIVMGMHSVEGATSWQRYATRFASLYDCEAHGKAFAFAWKQDFDPDKKTPLRLQTHCAREEDAPPLDLEGF